VAEAAPVTSETDGESYQSLEGVSIATTLRKMRATLSRSELKVAAVLLSNYPVAGLVNISSLARKAGVSDPTVTRLVTKLGFDGFASFKASLQSELEQRLMPPSRIDALGSDTQMETLASSATFLSTEISRSFVSLNPDDVECALVALADLQKHIYVCGGRVSSALAQIFSWSLEVLRPKVSLIGATPGKRVNALLDISSDSVLVVFDYRRYQADTVALARQAKDHHATVILFTDPYLSPAASFADVVLYASIAGLTPFDSMTPSLALLETVISMLISRIGEGARGRVKKYAELSETFENFTRSY
jgi:DNA-binding MurR/RpiR family transcriptional regulator